MFAATLVSNRGFTSLNRSTTIGKLSYFRCLSEQMPQLDAPAYNHFKRALSRALSRAPSRDTRYVLKHS
jgi:hypothetical protein